MPFSFLYGQLKTFCHNVCENGNVRNHAERDIMTDSQQYPGNPDANDDGSSRPQNTPYASPTASEPNDAQTASPVTNPAAGQAPQGSYEVSPTQQESPVPPEPQTTQNNAQQPYAGSYAQQPQYRQSQYGQQTPQYQAPYDGAYSQPPAAGTGASESNGSSYGAPQYNAQNAPQYASGPSYGQQHYAGYGPGQPYSPGFSPAGAPPLNKPYYGCPFPEAIKRFFQKYVVFKGRASKSELWWAFLGVAGVNMILSILNNAADHRLSWLSTLWSLAVFLPSLSVLVRRVHDSNKSGWWAALPYGLGVLAGLFAILVAVQTIATVGHAVFTGSARGGAGIVVLGLLTALCGIGALASFIVLGVANSDPAGIQYDDDFQSQQAGYPGGYAQSQPYSGQPYAAGQAPYGQNQQSYGNPGQDSYQPQGGYVGSAGNGEYPAGGESQPTPGYSQPANDPANGQNGNSAN